VDQDDVQALAERGATIAHCPRSNAVHRHGRALLQVFHDEGIPVGLGTDSVVSVGKLDLWAEAEAAGFSGDAAIRALTLDGARALGWEREIGSLEVGKAGDLALMAVGPSGRQAVVTVVAGRIVHRAGSPEAH
jgi:5-methylthioadenosine/S-adenosylhomocysteine deaminase